MTVRSSECLSERLHKEYDGRNFKLIGIVDILEAHRTKNRGHWRHVDSKE
jgi:hypothetical protein